MKWVDEKNVMASLGREDMLCLSKWIVGVTQIVELNPATLSCLRYCHIYRIGYSTMNSVPRLFYDVSLCLRYILNIVFFYFLP